MMDELPLEKAFSRLPLERRALERLLAFCRTPKTLDEIDGKAQEVLAYDQTTMSAPEMTNYLVEQELIVPEGQVEEEGSAGHVRPYDEYVGPWICTDEALAYLNADQSLLYWRQKAAEDEEYLPIYGKILSFVGTSPRNKAEIDRAVDNDPLLKKSDPRRFAGYFVDVLEHARLIVWEGSWRITERGKDVLAEIDGR